MEIKIESRTVLSSGNTIQLHGNMQLLATILDYGVLEQGRD